MPRSFARPGPKKPLSDLLINRFSVPYRKEAEEPRLRVDFINDPEASGSIFPEPLEIPAKRLAGKRVQAQSPDGLFDAAFNIRRQVANDFRYVGWNVGLKYRHYRFRTFGG